MKNGSWIPKPKQEDTEMKLKKGFVLTDVGQDTIAVPVGSLSKELHGIVRLNETGAFIWHCLEQDQTTEQIVERMLSEYDIDAETARRAVQEIVDKLAHHGLLEE